MSDLIQEVTNAFRALQDQIPGIFSFEHGINNSPEDANLGFTHIYTLTFEGFLARDTYPSSPTQEIWSITSRIDILADAFIVDYVPEP